MSTQANKNGNPVKKITYLVILLLALQVIKAVLVKFDLFQAFFLGILIGAIQFLIVTALLLFVLNRFVLKNFFSGKRLMVLTVVLMIVQLVGLELLFGWWLKHPAKIPGFLFSSFRYYYFQYHRRIFQYEEDATAFNDKLFYTLKPNSTFTFWNSEFHTSYTVNSAGMRDDSASLDKPEIICLGDSYMMGWGVEQQETFAQQLEKKTSKKVLNGGVSSYGTAREILSLSNVDLSKLQYLLIQYCTNDEAENRSYIDSGYRLETSSEALFDKIRREHSINKQYFPGEHFATITKLWLKQNINKVYRIFPLDKEGDGRISTGDLALFLDIVAKAPVDFAKVKVLLFQFDEPPTATNRFAALTDSLLQTPRFKAIFNDHVEVVNLEKTFTRDDYFILDTHLRASGYTKAVDTISQRMKAH